MGKLGNRASFTKAWLGTSSYSRIFCWVYKTTIMKIPDTHISNSDTGYMTNNGPCPIFKGSQFDLVSSTSPFKTNQC